MEKQRPSEVRSMSGGFFADFGKAAFGRLEYEIECDEAGEAELVIGECLTAEGEIDRAPGGFRCVKSDKIMLRSGVNRGMMRIPKHRSPYQDSYQRSKVLTPEIAGGEITPFRYAEIHGKVKRAELTRHALFAPFDDRAARFESSDADLNKVWEFCKYSIKATGAFGIYIDGDRERQAFEGDAYINALGAYCTGGGYETARRTLDFLISFYPIPCLEYRLITPVLVRDYILYSGDTEIYRYWKNEMPEKLLTRFLAEDGLFHHPREVDDDLLRKLNLRYQYFEMFPDKMQFLVDWPWSERDNYEFGEINFIPHAFLLAAYRAMAQLEPDAGYDRRAEKLHADMLGLFRRADGRYVDHSGGEHMALHSAMFAIAWDVAPESDYPALLDFITRKGMACSVYGAQFLLDACFKAGAEQYALDLMRSDGPRSWLNMMKQGSTVTMEAWDNTVKPNQDWNHAWGAAPANVIPRRLAGIRPTAAGFRKFTVDPKPGDLKEFVLTHPTPLGNIELEYTPRSVRLVVPEGAEAICGKKRYESGTHTVNPADFR